MATALASRPTCMAARPAIRPAAARRPLRMASQPRSRTIVRADPTKVLRSCQEGRPSVGAWVWIGAMTF